MEEILTTSKKVQIRFPRTEVDLDIVRNLLTERLFNKSYNLSNAVPIRKENKIFWNGVVCDKCGTVNLSIFQTSLFHYNCKVCANNVLTESKLVAALTNTNYELSEYNCEKSIKINDDTYHKFRCKKHNTVEISDYTSIVYAKNHCCKECIQKSYAEYFMKLLLKANDVFFTYDTQCDLLPKDIYGELFTSLGDLRFDFAIPDYKLIVEIDGDMHRIDKYGGLVEQQKKDKQKDDFVSRYTNWKLVRVPYYQFDEEFKKDLIAVLTINNVPITIIDIEI